MGGGGQATEEAANGLMEGGRRGGVNEKPNAMGSSRMGMENEESLVARKMPFLPI